MEPVVGCRSPAIRLNSVLLPAPLGPRMPRVSPCLRLSDRPSTAASEPNRFDRLSIRSRSSTRPAPPVNQKAGHLKSVAGPVSRLAYSIAASLVTVGIDGAALLSAMSRSYLNGPSGVRRHWPPTSGVVATFGTGPLPHAMGPT